jgi:hypothetical protein
MSFMLSVANKPIMLSVVKLSVVMPGVIMLNVVEPQYGASLTDDYRGVIYNHNMVSIQATEDPQFDLLWVIFQGQNSDIL